MPGREIPSILYPKLDRFKAKNDYVLKLVKICVKFVHVKLML